LSLATDVMAWNVTEDKIVGRMAVSTDNAWSVPGGAHLDTRDRSVGTPSGPLFVGQDIAALAAFGY
jgi:ribonuclease Z